MSDKTQKFCDMSLHSCNNGNNGISFNSLGTWAGGLGLLWAWIVHEIFGYLAYWWRTIFYDCCIFDIYEIKKHSQVKVIHGSTTDSISSCFLIHYIITSSLVVLRQRTDVLVAEPFFRLITLDASPIPSTFVARRRAGLLLYHS